MFVITGATGNTGSVAAETLLAAGKSVRVVVRSAAKAKALAERGAEVVEADLNDEAAMTAAFRGADGVFLLSPPDVTLDGFLAKRKQLLETLARAAKAAQVKHAVFLSSVGAQHADGTGIIRSAHAGEQALRASGLPVTFVRAAYFVENWGSVLHPARQDGVLPSFVPANQTIAMVASRDIGTTVANALLDGPRGTRVIELSGPKDLSPKDIAAALSEILGRPVNVAEAPLAAVVPTLMSFGFSADVAELFRGMMEGIANGKVAFEGKEAVRGTTSAAEVLRSLTEKQ